jgi:nucleoid-associated protein YejK
MTSKRARAISALPVKRKKERANDYMRGSPSTGERMRVQDMSETMEQIMEREIAEAIATLNKANRALDRLFNTTEGESDE